VIPPTTRQYWVPISDLRHDFDAGAVLGTPSARAVARSPCAHLDGRGGAAPAVKRIDMGTPIG